MFNKKWILVLLILLFKQLVFAQYSKTESQILCLVNDIPISIEEFKHFAIQERSSVIQFFRRNYKLEYCDNYWSKSCYGITPKDLLIKKTLDTLISIKIQQNLAKEYGLVDDISYSGFLINLSIENKRRIEDKNFNKPIYGPVQYSVMSYYNYRFSNMVILLKKKLNDELFKITEDKLIELYQEEGNSHGDSSFVDCKEIIKSKYLDKFYYELISNLLSIARIETNLETINSIEFE